MQYAYIMHISITQKVWGMMRRKEGRWRKRKKKKNKQEVKKN